MKQITKFQAKDGTEFPTENEAHKYEALLEACATAMLPIHVPKELQAGVELGQGWHQHDPAVVVQCRNAILGLCCLQGLARHYPVFHERGPDVNPFSIIGRILDDMGGPLNRAWGRFMRIDAQGREHQQPYFAINGPDKGQVCLNP